MNKLTTIETDLTKAQKELAEFQADLPQFYSLLSENEADAQRLKTEKASLDVQAQARGRVQIAKEMLEQHHADIATARAEVERLELIFERENALQILEQHATDAARHKNAFDDRLASANKTLEGSIQKLLVAYDDLTASRQAFATVAGDDKVLISELAERGVLLTQGPTPYQAYPAPYGAVIGEFVMSIISERAMAAERARWAAQRSHTQKTAPPKLPRLCVDQRDASVAAHRLGELAQAVINIDKGMVGENNETVFSILPTDLEQARERLKGALTFGDASSDDRYQI